MNPASAEQACIAVGVAGFVLFFKDGGQKRTRLIHAVQTGSCTLYEYWGISRTIKNKGLNLVKIHQ